MIFKLQLHRITSSILTADSIYFLKIIFRDSEQDSSKFFLSTEGCNLNRTFSWVSDVPIDESDVLTIKLYQLINSSAREISTYETLMECYSPFRIYSLRDQFKNEAVIDFFLYFENYDNELILKAINQNPLKNFNPFIDPLSLIDLSIFEKTKNTNQKLISYGTFN